MGIGTIIRNYRTVTCALIGTLVLLGFVFAGKLEPARAAATILLAWVFATHSLDNNEHKSEIVKAVRAAAEAGIEWRSGRKKEACDTVTNAAEGIAEDLRQERGA